VEVRDDDRLDPGDDDFVFGARVLMESSNATEGSNVLQKGRFSTTGGQWKLQVDGTEAKPSCILQSDGTAGRQFAEVVADVSMADGEWHDIECQRVADALTITVDGTANTVPSAVGSIANDEPVRIGAAGVSQGDDQFRGALDDVRFCIPTCP
jgi:hypothetical protein